MINGATTSKGRPRYRERRVDNLEPPGELEPDPYLDGDLAEWEYQEHRERVNHRDTVQRSRGRGRGHGYGRDERRQGRDQARDPYFNPHHRPRTCWDTPPRRNVPWGEHDPFGSPQPPVSLQFHKDGTSPEKLGSTSLTLTETGRARKKIVFEFEEIVAGTLGGGNEPVGEDKVSSPKGEREGGRWKRKARPGPFEASTDVSDVVPGILPLLAADLRFSMGRKEGSVGNQPEIKAGTGQTGATGTWLEGDRPEEKSVVAQEKPRSTSMEVAASTTAMDEDISSNGNGTNMLSETSNFAAPFPEKARSVLAVETCDSPNGESAFEFKFEEGTTTVAEENNDGGEGRTRREAAGTRELAGKATGAGARYGPAGNSTRQLGV
ncbi:hypothetical protein SASPL_135442 [Salvia splendens]|uniref:Uncharacterized protein n=1 Tax=Salvia splendens TaxID=180675 RepID=A0A8X8WY67_SALSN|nr:hypothetical protein SASPL_135442 [Salvia splendens]